MTKQSERKSKLTSRPRGTPELKFNEYYVNDAGGRVQKGRVTDIIGLAGDEMPRYILRNNRGRIKGPWRYDSFLKAEMYDNAEDCKARTHGVCDYWERLREIQDTEMKKIENKEG